MLLGRASVIASLPVLLPAGQVGTLYDQLKEESDAFGANTSVSLTARATYQRQLHAGESLHPTGSPPTATDLQATMNGQYLILTEHPFVWNAVTNTEDSIEPHPLAPIQRTFNGKQDGWCDRPFKACDPRRYGFLDSLPKALVVALTHAGLEWGACMMGSQSGRSGCTFKYTVPRTCFKRTVDQAKKAARSNDIGWIRCRV